jgi:steroid 5-alpha reductase family enzyme
METLLQEIGTLFAVNFAVAIGAVIVLWLISIPIRDVSIIDMFFAVILFAITVVSFVLGGGAENRKLLVLVLVGLWALRITVHLIKRNWGHGEDPRYTKLRSWVKDDRSFNWLSLRKVFLLQGMVLWVTSFPVQAAMVFEQPASLGWPALAGIALWTVGFLFEAISDAQLTRFRADESKRGTVLQTGLWKYSRHPNYFGELCVWWGLFLVACDHPAGSFTIIGPLVYSYLVINITGQRTLDKKLAKEKPGYREYMETTSGLIPMPPRKRDA